MQPTEQITQKALTPTEKKRKPLFIRLAIRLLVAFTLVFGIVFGGAYYWFYHYSTNVAMDRLKEDLTVLLTGVAGQINGDEFDALIQAGGTPTADGYTPNQNNISYWSEVRFLNQISEIDPRASVYTYARGPQLGEVVFVTDGGMVTQDPAAARFLQSVIYPPKDAKVILAGLDHVELYMKIYKDPNFPGSWVSGYAPIKNKAGQTVGAVGIDFRADYVTKVQNEVKNGFAPAAGISAILLIGMVYFVSRILTRPVVALTKAAELIGEGHYEQDLSGLTGSRFTDEIGTLARVFEIMVDKVRQREEKLKKQVADLQIMIDESKRQEQVAEIVDSDFFRDLQTKARNLRQGFAALKSGTPPQNAPEPPKPEG